MTPFERYDDAIERACIMSEAIPCDMTISKDWVARDRGFRNWSELRRAWNG